VGKSHLAIALALKAIEHLSRVLFTTAAAMTAALASWRTSSSSTRCRRLLIIDEIGYLPIERQGANLFFQPDQSPL
jgi:DNA replication protein DnaC